MSADGYPEQELLLTRLEVLCGGQIYDSVPEETELARDADGLVLPYIVVSFGDVMPLYGDRSIEGEEAQPHSMVVVMECWGSIQKMVRATAGAVRTRTLGWEANDNAGQMSLGRGGRFTQTDAEGRPTRYMQSVTAEMPINMSVEQPIA